MDIRYKMFPYPVLAYYSDDYQDSVFETSIEPCRDGYNLRLEFMSKLINDDLQALIDMEKAAFVYHLECSQTGFRKAIKSFGKISSVKISHKEVCGRLQICPFVVATCDIQGYSSNTFHEDYQGMSFNIEAGCILAVGNQFNADIEKEIDDLSNVPSIFSIIPNLDTTQTHMIVETQNQKITIMLPQEDHGKYSMVNQNPEMQAVLNSMVIVPALITALEEVKRAPIMERYEFEKYGWYRSIQKVLREKFNCDIASNQFDSISTLEYAQRLIDEPIHEAFTAMLGIEKTQDGGEDG